MWLAGVVTRRRHNRGVVTSTGQIPLFAAYGEPAVADLEGLLLGPAQVVTRTSTTGPLSRLSVVVDEAWRATALVATFTERGLTADRAPNPRGGATTVRSGFGAELAPLARRWTRGSRKRIPDGFGLTAANLRPWAIAAGRREPTGYLLRLGGSDEQIWAPIAELLTAAGVTSGFVGTRGGGPAYRITGRRGLRRLADLLGEPPAGVPKSAWPS